MLSVALCTYNGEQYIREQLESILHQTMKVDEIVVCDDGSTDETLSIIESLRRDYDTDIRVQHNKKKLGICANFQSAINLCQGDIIFLSDQDDIWRRDKVETVMDYFDKHEEKQVVFTDGQLVKDTGISIDDGTLWKCFGITRKSLKWIDAGYGIELFAYENRATGATMALRRSFEYAHNFINFCLDDILHDGALALLSMKDNRLGYIDKCLIDYRIHKKQECGIGERLLKPLSGDPRDTDFIAVLWNRLPLPSPIDKRIAFIVLRQRHQHQPLGIFRMIGSIGCYCKYYRSQWLSFIFFDIKQWSIVMWRRIFK